MFLLYFLLNKCSPGEHKSIISKALKNLTDPKLLNIQHNYIYYTILHRPNICVYTLCILYELPRNKQFHCVFENMAEGISFK